MATFTSLFPIGIGDTDYPADWTGLLAELDARFETAATFGGTVSVTGKLSTAGAFAIASGQKAYLDGVSATGDTYIHESAANTMGLVVGGATTAILTSNVVTLTAGLMFSGDATWDIGALGATRPRDIYVSRNVAIGGDLSMALTKKIYLDGGVDTYLVQSSGGIIALVCDAGTEAEFSSAIGGSRLPNGIRLGANSTNNLLDDASNGAGTATLYIGNAAIQVSSGLELKENIVDTKRDALSITDALRVVDFTWNDPSDTAPNNRNSRGVWTGLIAQEAVEHVPWLVNAPDPKCPTCLAGETCAKHPSHWFMDLAYMAPLLVRAIQQLKTRVIALEGA